MLWHNNIATAVIASGIRRSLHLRFFFGISGSRREGHLKSPISHLPMQLPLIASPTPSPPPPLELIGTQGDIRYYDQPAKGVLNSPESTGMPFWSINPYVGCAFGCAYCYARYAHRYVAERKTAAGSDEGHELTELPAWLAFERRIFVKRNAAEVLRETLERPEARGQARAPENWHRTSHDSRFTIHLSVTESRVTKAVEG